ncbi:MAG: cell division protein ZapA [Acidobacteria bacterium]|nr:cell division protein ZapA [Acidobacteriota bacterium]
MSSANSVEVTIFDQTYNLRSTGDAEHIREVAGLVDERMKQIASQITTYDVSKIAILAALNIADEMQNLKAQFAVEVEQILTRASVNQVDEKTNDAQPEGERATWFDEIFEAEISPKDKAQRLSSQVSAKLKSLRKTETPRPSIEETED